MQKEIRSDEYILYEYTLCLFFHVKNGQIMCMWVANIGRQRLSFRQQYVAIKEVKRVNQNNVNFITKLFELFPIWLKGIYMRIENLHLSFMQ